jgi:hypothetical protein
MIRENMIKVNMKILEVIMQIEEVLEDRLEEVLVERMRD